MKRLLVAAALCAAFLLPVGAAAASAGAPPPHGHDTKSFSPAGRQPLSSADLAPGAVRARFVPLARTLTGTATVKVHAYDYSGNPWVGAAVRWWVTTETEQATDFGYTDASGSIAFTDVPGADTGQGEVAVYPAEGSVVYDVSNLSWLDPAGTDMGLQPGKVGMQLTAGGDWSDYGYAWFDIYSTNGDAQQYTGSSVPADAAPAEPLVLQGALTDATVYFWDDQGTELSLSGLSVRANDVTPSGIEVQQADCPTIYNFTWASGKPGSAARISFRNFPAGWVNAMYGASDGGGPVRTYSDWVSPGGTGWTTRTFTVPATAVPGFDYTVYASHATGPLTLSEPFQVCTFKPSRTRVSRTGTVRFSGRVPFDAGHSKRLTIYRRTTAAGQPPKAGGSTVRGWTKVGTATANGSGRYTTKHVQPRRTSWYVLWYPGDGAQNWGAWTSVAKVTVR
jgi:hypothetical protein